MLLATGEQISIALLAMAIEAMGFPVDLPDRLAGGHAYGLQLRQRPDSESIDHRAYPLASWTKRKIVLMAGFQGINKYDDITTLGRGGSDTTAVAHGGGCCNADLCQIYTDVDGVYTADPRLVTDARKLDEISLRRNAGAWPLWALRCCTTAPWKWRSATMWNWRYFPALTRNFRAQRLRRSANMEKMNVSGVAKDNDVAQISLVKVRGRAGHCL